MGAWQLEPMPLAAAAVALVLYAKGFRRLRRRRRSLARRGTGAAFVGGVAVALLAVSSPLDALGEQKLLTAHMAQHLLLGDVAPLLLVLGLRGPMGFFVLPREALRALARAGLLRRTVAFVLRPWVSLAAWAIVVYAWHVPAFYDAAIASPPLHAAEHALFVAAGLLVWTQILDPARRGRLSPGRRAVFAAGVLLAGMPLSELLIASGSVLYPHYAAIAHRPLGLTSLEDQARAGLLMMAEQVATLATAAALLLWTHVDGLATASERSQEASPDASADRLAIRN